MLAIVLYAAAASCVTFWSWGYAAKSDEIAALDGEDGERMPWWAFVFVAPAVGAVWPLIGVAWAYQKVRGVLVRRAIKRTRC
jgi:hypothetical protein